MMGWVAAAVGVVGSSIAWALIRRGGVSIWWVMPVLYLLLGAAAVLFGDPRLAEDPRLTGAGPDRWWSVASQVALGLGVGIVLFAATHVFVRIVGRWRRFAADTRAQYAQRLDISVRASVALTLVALVGEELYWRGVVQPGLADVAAGVWAGPVLGAALAWAAYLVANLESRSLPVLAGAAVAGGSWAVLPLLTGGIAASICCHAAWTVLMLLLPPRVERGMMAP
ncbi:MAG TPA: CPBP family intramembrane glutamic endopeptidase [Actinomycetota bacterium]